MGNKTYNITVLSVALVFGLLFLIVPFCFADDTTINKNNMLAGINDQVKKNETNCTRCRGFYWYEKDEPIKEKEEKPKETKALEQKPEEEDKQEKFQLPEPVIPPPLNDLYTEKDILNMHPQQIRYLSTMYLEKAIFKPSVENVKDYLTIQNVIRMKSHVYSNVSSFVVQTTPKLSLEADFPVVTIGRESYIYQSLFEINNKLATSKEEFALLYFYSPKCKYCEVQSKINTIFTYTYKWDIKEVNVDDHPDMYITFNIKTIPYIILIKKSNPNYFPIAVGVTTADEMAERVYNGIRYMNGEITPEQWNLKDFQRGGAFDIASILNGR